MIGILEFRYNKEKGRNDEFIRELNFDYVEVEGNELRINTIAKDNNSQVIIHFDNKDAKKVLRAFIEKGSIKLTPNENIDNDY